MLDLVTGAWKALGKSAGGLIGQGVLQEGLSPDAGDGAAKADAKDIREGLRM